jgi:hypothetical protein
MGGVPVRARRSLGDASPRAPAGASDAGELPSTGIVDSEMFFTLLLKGTVR